MSSAANANDPLLPGYQAGARTIGWRREVATGVAGVGIEPTWFQAYEAWQGPALPAFTMPLWSPATDSHRPPPDTGRVRRLLRLQGRARRPPHQVTADLQTCDTRSAGAFFIRRHHDISSWIPTLRLIRPASLDQQDGGARSRLEFDQ